MDHITVVSTEININVPLSRHPSLSPHDTGVTGHWSLVLLRLQHPLTGKCLGLRHLLGSEQLMMQPQGIEARHTSKLGHVQRGQRAGLIVIASLQTRIIIINTDHFTTNSLVCV